MANTKTSAKRARQAVRRQAQNQAVRSETRSAIRGAFEGIKTNDVDKARAGYILAVRALSKAASKGCIPQRRAARKISRLTKLAKKTIPTLSV